MIDRRGVLIGLPLGLTVARLSRAQPRPRVLGILNPYISADMAESLDQFDRALLKLGYVKGTHYVIVTRMSEGKNERLRGMADELVNLKVDVIFAASTNAVMAAHQATSTIPIVFVSVTDPVGSGFADSLAHPGHNMTGLSNFSGELTSKRLELMKEMVPGLNRLAILANPTNPLYAGMQRTRLNAEQQGLRTSFFNASTSDEFEAAFKAMIDFHAGAVYVMADPFLWDQRKTIADFTLRNRLPTMSAFPECVEAGGLMSYGADTRGVMVQAAAYADKILRGIRPGDIPIEQATKVDLVINRKTATAMQLAIPQVLLLQADRVVE